MTVGATVIGMMLVGSPILTAMTTLFGSVHIFDAQSDVDMAADRIIVHMQGLVKYRILEDRPDVPKLGSRDCEAESGYFHEKDGGINRAVVNVGSAMYKLRSDLDGRDAYLVALTALKSLPLPILGALDGCIRASLLASYCEERTRAVLQKAIESERGSLKDKYSKNARLLAEMICVAVDGMKSQQSSPSPK